jgi:hypothetical protein
VPKDSARTFLRALEVFRPAFTAPTFARWLLLMAAWVLCTERHAVTECLVVSGAAGVWEHSAFHRVFSRRRWDLDALAQLWLAALVERLAARGMRLQFVIDDTLGTHKGPSVFGLGTHLDAVRSTRKRKVFTFGHVWVTCALVVTVPFSPRPFALPLLFRLYRGKKECALHGGLYRTKTEQARELVELLLAWLPKTSFDLLLDAGYTNRVVLRGLPSRVRVLGALTIRAALTTAGGRTLRNGRHSAKGAPRASLAAWADDAGRPWETIEARVYGGLRAMHVKTAEVQWWSVLGAPSVRVVLLRCTTGTLPLRAFLCTDPAADAASILTGYACRWSIEVYFFEVKQFLGLCASRARLEWAVRRTAPCVGLLYGVLVLGAVRAWAAGRGAQPSLVRPQGRGELRGHPADRARGVGTAVVARSGRSRRAAATRLPACGRALAGDATRRMTGARMATRANPRGTRRDDRCVERRRCVAQPRVNGQT